MSHPGEKEFMPVNTTWGVLHSSHMHPSHLLNILHSSAIVVFFNRLFSSVGRRRPQVSIEEFSFLERIFQKTKPE